MGGLCTEWLSCRTSNPAAISSRETHLIGRRKFPVATLLYGMLKNQNFTMITLFGLLNYAENLFISYDLMNPKTVFWIFGDSNEPLCKKFTKLELPSS